MVNCRDVSKLQLTALIRPLAKNAGLLSQQMKRLFKKSSAA